MDKLILILGSAILVLMLIGGFALTAAAPTYFLWNWRMPDLFGLHIALGINILAGILFKK